MKMFHLSDLHLGKTVNGFSMYDEQKHIIEQILAAADKEKIDGVMIAGDIYDKAVPSTEAVDLCDYFLTQLCKRGLYVFIISGNHDSARRLSFGSEIFEQNKLYISPVFGGTLSPVVINDEFGEIAFYLLPFIKPVLVRKFFPDEEITDTNCAVKLILDNTGFDETRRNIILSHQFITGAKTCESEEISVGDSDNVSSALYEKFDYAALGHLHIPQHISKNYIHYCGSPLKYSFSECKTDKSITMVDFGQKGNVNISEIPLTPIHDMREIRGEYLKITNLSEIDKQHSNDYLHITLTDDDERADVLNLLRRFYPNIMRLDYDNRRTAHYESIEGAENAEKKSPYELFSELFETQNGDKMNDEQQKIVLDILTKICDEEV